MTTRRAGWLSMVAGAGLVLAVQVLAPVGVPLYDGVVVQEPYRFLHPAAGQAGDPTAADVTETVAGGVSPALVVATGENPPQAQLIAQRDAYAVSPGIWSVRATINAVEPPAPAPSGSTIAGNVYRFTVADQADNPLTPTPCEGCRSLVLRAPDGTGEASMFRFAGGAWTRIPTVHAGVVAMYQTNPTAPGEYAVMTVASTLPVGGEGNLVFLLVGAAIVVLFFGFIGLLLFRARAPAPSPESTAPVGRPGQAGAKRGVGGAGPGRVPSKRRGSKRPPSGRSGE